MACKTSYELHHNFPKVAEESGFTFNTHKPRVHIDWNKIRLIDIDSLIRERKFITIEQHLNDILDCVLESEFDVRILDEGVLKLFRLAQLAVEYQQFCRHYLDRSVYVLRQEITSLAQELNICRKNLQDKEEEQRKLRKITKHTQKYPLPYNNDNIATMILKSLSTKGIMFPTSSNVDNNQYHKCNYCDKVFLNQLYLQSHVSRRHPNFIEIPQKETQNNENMKLSSEIIELKTKLNAMETFIMDSNKHMQEIAPESINKQNESSQNMHKVMKDAEVSTNQDNYLLDKIEEWKKVEREEYSQEINKLRSQIIEIINSFKQNESQHNTEKDSKIFEQFHATIIQQGAEISALKKELESTKINAANENFDKSREFEAQITLWTQRTDAQSKQYEALLQKLNDVAKDAKESRLLAMAERERAMELQTLLEQNLNNKVIEDTNNSFENVKTSHKISEKFKVDHKPITELTHKSHNLSNNISLENLHKKAQELLNISSLSSSSSDGSSKEKNKKVTKFSEGESKRKYNIKLYEPTQCDVENRSEENKRRNRKKVGATHIQRKSKEHDNKDLRKEKIIMEKRSITGSPIKIVRAKLTEDVNNRLVTFGIDPFNYRLPQNVFQSYKSQLIQLRDKKAKENPAHEKIRHLLLAYLDSSITNSKNENGVSKYVPTNKSTKPFRNITSVISGVKSKAMSLVKLKDSRKSIDTEVANRALTFLKTPPDSASQSPQRKIVHSTTSNSNNDVLESSENINGSTLALKVGTTSNETKKHFNNEKELNYISYSTSDESTDDSDQNKNAKSAKKSSIAVENLIKSPARRPSSASNNYMLSVQKYVSNDTSKIRTQSELNLNENKRFSAETANNFLKNNDKTIKDIGSTSTISLNKATSEENIIAQTKGVLKNALSTSTLNKKKVIFDMDAIQMKSLSASNSQSITEKSNPPLYELGLSNIDGEEWDMSSIENEPLKNDTKLQFSTNTSPKIAELKQQIESQLARRVAPSTTGLVGAVDVLGLGITVSKTANISGSNTSLGSSILDEPELISTPKRKTLVKSQSAVRKDDSDMEVSDFSLDGITRSNKNDTF